MMIINAFNYQSYNLEPLRDYHVLDGSHDNFNFANTTILPYFPENYDFMNPNNRVDEISNGDMINYEDTVYPEGDKDFARMFPIHDNMFNSSEWRTKSLYSWNENDVKNWLLETGLNKGFKVAEIPSFGFTNMTGADLVKMTKENFCKILRSQSNHEESISIAETLYDDLKNFKIQQDRDSVVPTLVMDINAEDDMHSKEFLNLDNCYKQNMIDAESDVHYIPDMSHGDPGYDLKLEDSIFLETDHGQENMPVMVTKRPPGRPKGSGKKHQKRVKNVSVPEFLRDLLLNSKYCPRIIKWEDYSAGKFRFVRPDEVAKLWGGKKNNSKMSFEKFSRAMRYHYKQQVLVSVPTARLVYQFGPKAPRYNTPNPNFESDDNNFSMR